MSEATCRAVITEFKTKGSYQQQVYLHTRSSYRDHYRRMVPLLVNMLRVRSTNTQHQPVMRALDLIKRYAGTPGTYYPADEEVPIDGVVRAMWRELVVEKKDGEQRINRVNYELCVLAALRDGLRCRELWVEGANKYRNYVDYERLHIEEFFEDGASIPHNVPLLRIRGTQTGDSRGAQRHRELERGQQFHLLRQERRFCHQPAG